MKMEDWILGSGSSVYENDSVYSNLLKLGKWHRSKDMKGGENNFGSYMFNKKWTLEEEFNNHMLRFQQVTLFGAIKYIYIYSSKLHFNNAGWIIGQ